MDAGHVGFEAVKKLIEEGKHNGFSNPRMKMQTESAVEAPKKRRGRPPKTAPSETHPEPQEIKKRGRKKSSDGDVTLDQIDDAVDAVIDLLGKYREQRANRMKAIVESL